ncbi:ABC transporter ATP-binding protein [candidate division WOR-1 bacterium RIFOXYA12_FULL_43_27]|uniref:ABC transporter ATP-binding protein n=1 Tax=candidate division WOR-1 bacterium RIFOXYC2_FULL_46_14 TaxID=1802587 RepID=A0A1F4U7V8_UNCSA|nr:MAG: ABC transporter ATP-binding protein [candidate division WOR-1 bacterium RIFOXYA12_FULL_43_27]OGC19393.1 MAG: ABC transporter ATP-binding protein [candidate division WOR-1 bacterium RIFOXYB2_FULL_46_45]OGC30382.1 MAG: ABC transporter ATP-binding protein [candidate division WOR-1 bacterium RIFOXYA2_FULL_46_56]OGC40982.1 MAG: ABC transporter ATP-binding protein [candidate division WOR-1 bacterium RIFOXYC2_FULL_46_14]
MLQINNVSLSFGAQTLLDDISLTVHSGERIGLVGRNGSGKTTLFKLIMGEIEPDCGRIVLPKNYTVGYLKQHLNFTEGTVLAEACLGLKNDEKDQVWKAEKILSGLGFSEAEFYKSPLEFSGGFQVRLNLAKVLLADPHLLLLDEPTNYLDIISIRWLRGFLQRWSNELMIITHDRDFMNSITTHTLAIHRQKMKKIEGDTIKLFEQIAVEEEVYEKTRTKEQKKRKEVTEFINRFRASAARASLVQSRVKALEKMGKKQELVKIADLGFRFNSVEFHSQNLMRVKEVTFGYTPERVLIDKLSFDVGKKDRICVIGKNGKGKSTLLRLLAKELAPLSGEIASHDNCRIGYFGQTNIERLHPKLTIEQEFSNLRPDLSYTEIRKTCGLMMFSGDLALKKISVLSGGEKSRVSLGKILLSPTNLLLLDEPTNHLDVESCDSMISALDEFSGAVIIVTHSEMFLHHLANKLIVFNEDRVFVFDGTYQDFLDRIGWGGESSGKKSGKKDNSDRKKQAALEAEYNKKHKALHEKIAKVEKHIDEEETVLEEINRRLVDATVDGRGLDVQKLQIALHQKQQTIDLGYSDLTALVNELDLLDKSKP